MACSTKLKRCKRIKNNIEFKKYILSFSPIPVIGNNNNSVGQAGERLYLTGIAAAGLSNFSPAYSFSAGAKFGI